MIPRIYNHSYTISADLVIPEGGVEGVIVAAFDHLGGFALYVQDGKLKHHYSMLGVLEYTQESETPLPAGDVNVELVFAADEPKPATGGEVTLLVNGEPVADGRMEHTVPSRFSGYAGMDIGCDNGLVVDRSYADKAPFRFTGEIKQVTFDIAPDMSDEDQAGAARARGAGARRARGQRVAAGRPKGGTMSDEQLDVLIAVYLIPDLAQQDFDAFVQLAEDKTITTDGVVLVTKDAEGEVAVQETGDHLGRKGAKVGGGVGLVVGLFAPPLLAATAVGARCGRARGQVRPQAARVRDRRQDGRRAAAGLGRGHRDLRARRRRRGRQGARELDPQVDRPDRQGLREGAQGRASKRPGPGSGG